VWGVVAACCGGGVGGVVRGAVVGWGGGGVYGRPKQRESQTQPMVEHVGHVLM